MRSRLLSGRARGQRLPEAKEHPLITPAPFKAAQSYGPADGDLFFGRDAEGVELTQFFLARDFAVLTAPSGVGKTSLLHARVIPLLERERWVAAWARPNEDPIASLQFALASYLLPDPRLEAEVVNSLRARIPSSVPATLKSGLSWYLGLPPEKKAQFRLFAPTVEDPSDDPLAPLPMVSRALRGSVQCDDLIAHFDAMVVEGEPLGVTPHTDLSELAGKLRDRATV